MTNFYGPQRTFTLTREVIAAPCYVDSLELVDATFLFHTVCMKDGNEGVGIELERSSEEISVSGEIY